MSLPGNLLYGERATAPPRRTPTSLGATLYRLQPIPDEVAAAVYDEFWDWSIVVSAEYVHTDYRDDSHYMTVEVDPTIPRAPYVLRYRHYYEDASGCPLASVNDMASYGTLTAAIDAYKIAVDTLQQEQQLTPRDDSKSPVLDMRALLRRVERWTQLFEQLVEIHALERLAEQEDYF